MKKIYTLFCLVIFVRAISQSPYPNFNFELGNLNNWSFYSAGRNATSHNLISVTPCTIAVNPTASACGFNIYDTVIQKTICSLSTTPPTPGRYTTYISPSGGVKIASYQFTVNAIAPVINIQYVMMLVTGASEVWADQPFNQIMVKDMSNNIIAGTFEDFTVTTHSALAIPQSTTSLAYCLGWGLYTKNLTGYIGQVLKVEIVQAPCAYSGHGGGALIDGYFSSVTGIKEADLLNPIQIVPNPANNYINVKSHNGEDLEVSIYDMQGRLLIDKASGSINVTDLENGMYILRAIGQKSSYTKTFIKE